MVNGATGGLSQAGALESGGMARVFPPGLCRFKNRATRAEVPFRNNIIGNFLVYQYQIETNLL